MKVRTIRNFGRQTPEPGLVFIYLLQLAFWMLGTKTYLETHICLNTAYTVAVYPEARNMDKARLVASQNPLHTDRACLVRAIQLGMFKVFSSYGF